MALIAGKYGIDIFLSDFDGDSSVAGVFLKREFNKPTILVNSNDPSFRQRFTIAHELGHFFLHSDKEHDVFYRKQTFNLNDQNPSEEIEANKFAAALLMPEDQVRLFWRGDKSFFELARLFDVSELAFQYRLKNLKLLR